MTGPLAAVWEIPEPLSTHGVRVDDDTVIILRRHGNPEGPRLVLSHGNGLAIDLYYPFVFEAIDSLYGEKPTIGVFHSISALASLHTPSRGGNYSALVLFAAPLSNAGSRYREFELRARRTADMLRQRTQWFQSREELADLHTYLPYFQRAVPGVFELVARTTLRDSQTGRGFELRCPS